MAVNDPYNRSMSHLDNVQRTINDNLSLKRAVEWRMMLGLVSAIVFALLQIAESIANLKGER